MNKRGTRERVKKREREREREVKMIEMRWAQTHHTIASLK